MKIKGFSNYEITSDGQVISLNYGGTGERRALSQKCKAGYMNVGIVDDAGVRKFKRVHRLVAEAFLSNPEGKPDVNHINGDKADNRVENLEWVTPKENIRHAFTNGLKTGHSPNKFGRNQGSKLGQSKLTEQIVVEIRKHHLETRPRGEKTWEKYGISEANYWYIVAKNGSKTWKHVKETT